MKNVVCSRRRRMLSVGAIFLVAAGVAGISIPMPQLISSSSIVRAATPDGVIEILEQPFTVRTSQYGIFRIVVPESVSSDNNASIEIRVHRRITSRDELRATSDEGSLSRVTDVATVNIPNLRLDESGSIVVSVPLQASNQGLSGLYMAEPGVYPVTVIARQKGQITARALTYMHRTTPNDPNGPATTSMVISLRASPSIQPDGSIVVSDDLRQRVNRFIDTISGVNAPFTLAVQPEILLSLQTSPNADDQVLLERLQRSLAGRTLALLPFVPVDVSAAARAGVSEEYLRQLRVGEDVSFQLLPESVIQRTTAIIADPLDDEGMNLLRDAGRRTVIVTPSAMKDFRFRESPSLKSRQERSDTSTMTLLLSDEYLHKAMVSPSGNHIESAHRVLAELVVHRNDLVNSGVSTEQIRFVVSSSDGSLPTQQFVQTFMTIAQREPTVSVANIVPETDAPPDSPSVSIPRVSSGDITERTTALADLQAERNATTSMMPEDDPRIFLWQQLDGLIISSAVLEYEPYINGLLDQFQLLRDSVTLANPGSVTLASRDGSIRFQMRNTAPEKLTVRIILESPKLEFPQGSQLITLAGSSTTDVVIPVITRTNGRFPVRLEITTPEGSLAVIEPITFSARVTALAGIGQFVTISFVLIVLAWWWASWRKSRRERALSGTVQSV